MAFLVRPVGKQYATLSVWIDEAPLAAFASTNLHAEVMADPLAGNGRDEFRALDDQRRPTAGLPGATPCSDWAGASLIASCRTRTGRPRHSLPIGSSLPRPAAAPDGHARRRLIAHNSGGCRPPRRALNDAV